MLSSLAGVVPLGRLHMRLLQLYLLARWKIPDKDITCVVTLDPVFLSHLTWWTLREM